MPKEEWGVKRLCPNCHTRFYDLQNDPMTCPNCGAVHSVDSLSAGKTRTMIADKADPKSVKETDEDGDDVILDDDDDEDADDVDLGDDDVLEDDDDDDDVPLDEIADVSGDDDET